MKILVLSLEKGPIGLPFNPTKLVEKRSLALF